MNHIFEHVQGHIGGVFRPRLLPTGQPVGAAFSPLSLFANGELGWLYDPSNISTLFQSSAGTTAVAASSDPVGYMADLSGNGWHQLQATAGKRPLYIVDGDLKALRFDGAASAMSAASVNLAAATKSTLVLCIKQNTTTTAAVLEHGTHSIGSGGLGVFVSNGTPVGSLGVAASNAGAYLANNSMGSAAPRTVVLTAVFDPAAASAGGKCAIRINGEAVDEIQAAASGTITDPFLLLDLYIGARTGTSLYVNMDLYFCALVGRELTSLELENLEAYAQARGGYYALMPTAFTDTGAATNLSDYYQSSAFASVDVSTSAESMTVFAYCNIYGTFPDYAEVTVYVDGVYNQVISYAADGRQVNTISLPPGSKTVSFVNGLQSKPGLLIGTWITGLQSTSAFTQTNLTPSNRILVYGDSISVGGNSTIPARDSWPMLVRGAHRPNSVALEAWGIRSLYEDCANGTLRAAFVAIIAAYSPATIWLAIGTNDYGLNKWTAAAFGTAYAALLDDLHTALPSAAIYCQTPILRADETANGLGSTLGDYRTQIGTAVSTRTAYCTLIDGTAFMTTASLGDGLHPTTAGHALYAAAVIAELGI